MEKHIAILQQYEGEDSQSLLAQYPFKYEEECKKYLRILIQDAKQNKIPVKYRMVEMSGDVSIGDNITPEAQKLIIPNGKFQGVPVFFERDV